MCCGNLPLAGRHPEALVRPPLDNASARAVVAAGNDRRIIEEPDASGQARGNTIRDLPLGQVRVSQYQALSLAFRPVLPVCADRIEPHVVIGGRACHLPFIDAAGEHRYQV
jgi:hypothetical protein